MRRKRSDRILNTFRGMLQDIQQQTLFDAEMVRKICFQYITSDVDELSEGQSAGGFCQLTC
jgi:hypothetical protein